MTLKNFKILIFTKIILIIFFYFNNVNSDEIFAESIIVLDKMIPKECGVKFSISPNEVIKVSIKKIRVKNKDETIISLSIKDESFEIKNANIITNSINLYQTLDSNKKNKSTNIIEGYIEDDKVSIFFQELFISGGYLVINDKELKINGPIDSKVRLEYLFCTGEMFHPKYKN